MSTEKVSTLILEVDLQCERCYTKIQKVLCKLQPKENISKIDCNKKNTVTISGPFDPQKLTAKLMSKACDVINKISEPPKKPTPPVAPPPSGLSTTNVNFKFNNVCVICYYPWPCRCSNPTPPPQPQPQPPAQDKKPADKPKEQEAKAPPQWSSTTNVNLEFNNICVICYPWPCRCQKPQQPPEPPHRQPCWSPCGGPSSCGGCGSCGGMHGCQTQRTCCPGPSSCRGCNGCKLVGETKFIYEEYPHNTCKLM